MKTMIYIMSPSYSGSTLLTFLLARYKEISTIGELKASALGDISEYYCSCGEKITECGFWSKLGQKMHNEGRKFSLDDFGTHFRSQSPVIDRLLRANVRGPLFESLRSLAFAVFPQSQNERNRIIDQNRELIEIISDIQGAPIFLDGSKDPVRLKHFYQSGLWDLRVIFLVRDGRGVANSYMKHVGVNMEVAADEWRHKCEEMYRVKYMLPESNVYDVKYEDLCRSTDDVLESILRFSGLDVGKLDADSEKQDQHILGNAMRLNSSSEIILDEKWKRMLAPQDIDVFNRICGKINEKLGYK